MSLRLRTRGLTLVSAVLAVLGTCASAPASAISSAPVGAVRPVAALTVTTTSLPAATVGVPYTATLQAVGGAAPYVWASSPLPAGLSMSNSGVLRGILRDAATTTVLFVVTDSLKKQAVSPGLQLVVQLPIGPSGQAWSWGYNAYGQVGDGTMVNRPLPVPVHGGSSVVALAGSTGSGFALRADGTVQSWGANYAGVLGNGSVSPDPSPLAGPVVGLTSVRSISAGALSVLALRSDHTVWSWGDNQYGELGTGQHDLNAHPVPAQIPGLTSVKAIAQSYENGYALRADGTVWAWGQNDAGMLADRTDGSIGPEQIAGLTSVVAIAVGGLAGYALRSDGTVWQWGTDYFDETKFGSVLNLIPAPVAGLASITAIASAYQTLFALRSDGTVWSFGLDFFGQLGNSQNADVITTPVQVSGLASVKAIASGAGSGYALRSDGTVWAWGDDSWGQLGDNPPASVQFRGVPVLSLGLSGVIALGGGNTDQAPYVIESP